MTRVQLETPSHQKNILEVDTDRILGLISSIKEVNDFECETWIFRELSKLIRQSAPNYIGCYLGYKWSLAPKD